MTSVIVRILLRYGSGALIAHGLLSQGDGNMLATDPDVAMLVETGLGAALALASEAWYWAAHRFGWAK